MTEKEYNKSFKFAEEKNKFESAFKDMFKQYEILSELKDNPIMSKVCHCCGFISPISRTCATCCVNTCLKCNRCSNHCPCLDY